LGTDFQAGSPLSNTSSISSKVFPFVSGAVRNMWMNAAPLKVANIMYIFQLIFHSKGGTANASTQFQNQFDAVAKDTAFARILVGKISDG